MITTGSIEIGPTASTEMRSLPAAGISSLGWTLVDEPARIEPLVDPTVPFIPTEDGGVEFDEHKMDLKRPYPFQVDGVWFVAVKRSRTDGDVRLYNLDQ